MTAVPSVRWQAPGHAWAALLLEREVVLAGLRDGVLGDGRLAARVKDDATTSDEVRDAFGPAVAREQALIAQQIEDPETALAQIVTSCELDAVEAEVLAICLAIELDDGLQTWVARATGDVAARRPTLGLLTRMLGPEAREALAGDGRLRRSALVDVADSGSFEIGRAHV